MGLELRNRLEAKLGRTLPATRTRTHPTTEARSDHLLQRRALNPPAGSQVKAPPTAGTDDHREEMDTMDGNELLAALDAQRDAVAQPPVSSPDDAMFEDE